MTERQAPTTNISVVHFLEWEREQLVAKLEYVEGLIQLYRRKVPDELAVASGMIDGATGKRRRISPAAHKPPGQVPWHTFARDEILQAHYEDLRIPPTEIVAKLQATPGPRVPSWPTIMLRARALGLRRRAGSDEEWPEGDLPEDRRPANFETVAKQAMEWGVVFTQWDDLGRVNAAADRRGHPGFARLFEQKRRRN